VGTSVRGKKKREQLLLKFSNPRSALVDRAVTRIATWAVNQREPFAIGELKQ